MAAHGHDEDRLYSSFNAYADDAGQDNGDGCELAGDERENVYAARSHPMNRHVHAGGAHHAHDDGDERAAHGSAGARVARRGAAKCQATSVPRTAPKRSKPPYGQHPHAVRRVQATPGSGRTRQTPRPRGHGEIDAGEEAPLDAIIPMFTRPVTRPLMPAI